MLMLNAVVKEDMKRIYESLDEDERRKFHDSTFLFTGGAGFLGFSMMNFLVRYKDELGIRKIICLDNFKQGYPEWLRNINSSGMIKLHEFNVITDNIADIHGAEEADYIFHMASIASPVFYRANPIETLDANVWGLRGLLDFYRDKKIHGLAFFSSSEIYGDPSPENIPTPETYRGNVDCQGPRACYDEAKRFGETMCFLFSMKYEMPISIIRPFNNYGPGMRLNDARVPADFANSVRMNHDIVIYSDGSPKRTFCYVSDAVSGYFKAILNASNGFNTFNIGTDRPEISIGELAEIYAEAGREIFDYTGRIKFESSSDSEYLVNNPSRRCPDINRARSVLKYNPQIYPEQGVRFFLEYIKSSTEDFLTW